MRAAKAEPPRKQRYAEGPRRPNGAEAAGPGWDPNHLRSVLDAFRAASDPAALVARDPVERVRAYRDPADQEVAGLIVAAVAYGRASVVREKAAALLARLGPSPARGIGSPSRRRGLRGFVYRFQRGEDFERFARAIHTVRRRHGSLRACFAAGVGAEDGDFGDAMAAFAAAIRSAWGADPSRGLSYLMPTTADGGAAKRLALYLRWMVRPDDGMDLGTWAGPDLPPAGLLAPLDTHVARIARYIGLTDRRTTDLATARAITRALARLDPADPLKYEMALCHLGIRGDCPARRDPIACAGCGIRSVCRL